MSEELIQRNLMSSPESMGAWKYYNIGSTTLRALRTAGIIPDRSYAGCEKKKPDALIVHQGKVLAAVEYKQPSQLRTKKQVEDAVRQELGTARALGAKVYIITDGERTFWINPDTGNSFMLPGGELISTPFSPRSGECIKLISKLLWNTGGDTLIDATPVDPLPLARQIWQDLWAVSGATPESCLYTFVELFIYKYVSDLGVLPPTDSFNYLASILKATQGVGLLEFYARMARPRIKELFPASLRDNTTIINGAIFVSKDDNAVKSYGAVFKKVMKRFHDFGPLENVEHDFKSRLFETFLKQSISKKNWGQFFTPLKVVRSIVSMADIRPSMTICDPACGVGKFLLEPILHDLNRYFRVENGHLTRHIRLVGFDKGFDRDEQKTIILAKANMLIYLSPLIRENPGLTKEFAELFNDTFTLQTNSILGTLAHPIKDEYDLILTNPPYVTSGSANLKDEITKNEELKNYYSVSAMGVEGLFMEWIVRALKPGGKAFVVVPDGIMNRSNDKRLRDFILEECEIDAVISLPIDTFFTTNKKTYILAVTKKMPVLRDGIEVRERQRTPVFTYLCSEIGETRDNYRFDMEQNDLAEAARQFNMFKGAKKDFTTPDKRCKLVDIDAFYNDSHWSVDRWWTREERVELGISEEESISVDRFISLVEDINSSIADFLEPLRDASKKKIPFQQSVEVSLAEPSLFELSIGKRILRKDFQTPRGDIPVYSANVFTPFVYSDKSNITDYQAPYVLWGIDGLFDFNVAGMGKPFATTDHCGAIKILNSEIDPSFLVCMLKANARIYGFDRGLRASLTNMARVKIAIPTTDNGGFDLEYQRYIAGQFNAVEQLKDEVRRQRERLHTATVHLDLSDYTLTHKTVSELFTIERGSGKYTKTYAQGHEGNYPLYSGNTFGEFASIDSYDYNTPCLSWAIDGLAGYMMVHKTPFSATNHRGVLFPKTEDIDIEYMKFALEPLLRQAKKGRLGDEGENEYTSLPPFMLEDIKIAVPVDKAGNISLEFQREIAASYLAIEECRRGISDKLDVLLKQRVTY